MKNQTHGLRKAGAVLACTLALGLTPLTAAADESTGEQAGWGAAAALSSLVYGPVKVAYALGGALVGGFAWLFSAGDNEVAKAVINPAVRGDYVVTPQILRGERSLEFIGRAPEYTTVADY